MNARKQPFFQSVAELVLCWLIPGSAFFIKKDTYRGLIIFFMLTLTFFLGLLLQGMPFSTGLHSAAKENGSHPLHQI